VLERQKILLSLVERNRSSMHRTVLVKLAFLLRQDVVLGGSGFYDFVPYKYGPFSFGLYNELGALARSGYVRLSESSVGIEGKLAGEVRERIEGLPLSIRTAVGRVTKQYGRMKRGELIQDVYERFPWYISGSELKGMLPGEIRQRSAAPCAVYTAGYEGMSIDAFLDKLLRNGMARIVDVRSNPVSRKYGFAKRSLGEIATKLQLQYRHLPELGIPSSYRSNLGDYESYQRLLWQYESDVLPKRQGEVLELAGLLREAPSVLVCFERDVRCCHRGRLADATAKASGLEVVHI